MKELLLSWGMLVLSVVFNALGVFVIKWKINEQGPVDAGSILKVVQYFWILLKNPVVFVSVVIFFLSPFLFAIALSRMPLTIAYPAQIGLNFALVLALTLMFLGEHLTSVKLAGIVFIMVGIYLLNK